ncbi:hypothetical protein Bbelb_140160 [Branchiostoma belcheri]|nr:hypothetical protein Bbelb_140160 [Branchiostoma belcheri]
MVVRARSPPGLYHDGRYGVISTSSGSWAVKLGQRMGEHTILLLCGPELDRANRSWTVRTGAETVRSGAGTVRTGAGTCGPELEPAIFVFLLFGNGGSVARCAMGN